MATMDVFKADAFSMMSLLQAIENIDYKPQFLGSLNIFEDAPQRTRVVAVESRDNELALIQTTPIGAPPKSGGAIRAKVRNFSTVRLAKEDTIYAEEIQGIRAFGSETELKQVQDEVALRQTRLANDMELTWEYHRLGAVQGVLLDADSSVIFNYFDEFEIAQPDEVEIDFGAATDGALRKRIESLIVRPLIRAAKGAFLPSTRIVALVGDLFWDALIANEEVRLTYLNQVAAAALREGTVFGQAFNFAGVEWRNYRGTDDNSTVAIATDEAKFFPVGAPGIFKTAWGPAEFMDSVNMPGRPLTPLLIPDRDRNAWVKVELYSYPLFICTRPQVLRRAVVSGT